MKIHSTIQVCALKLVNDLLLHCCIAGRAVSKVTLSGSSIKLSMTDAQFAATQELEAILEKPALIHHVIEKNMRCTGAQCMQMLSVWQHTMHDNYSMLAFPKSGKVKHRARATTQPRGISFGSKVQHPPTHLAFFE